MKPAALVRLAPLLAAPLWTACGDPIVPALTDLRYDGQAKDSPLVVLFSVDFADADGDLSAGVLETFIDQSPTGAEPLEMWPLFEREGLKENATEGTIGFVLELSFPDGLTPPAGTTFSIGARASDGADPPHASSTEEIRLKLDY